MREIFEPATATRWAGWTGRCWSAAGGRRPVAAGGRLDGDWTPARPVGQVW